MIPKVTLCITSYNRFDLLAQTIDTFSALNTYPIERIVVIEDSTRLEMKNKISEKYGDKVDLIFNEERIGQAPSIDKMYKTVNTPYIFHTEDDYIYTGNPNFVKDSLEILEHHTNINQVWVKHFSDFTGVSAQQFEDEIHQTASGVKFKMLKSPFCGWCGFSWYPGLRRLDDYKKMFPNGYSEFLSPEYLTSGVQTEAACNTNAMKQGYRAATLINTAGSHTGIAGRQTYK